MTPTGATDQFHVEEALMLTTDQAQQLPSGIRTAVLDETDKETRRG